MSTYDETLDALKIIFNQIAGETFLCKKKYTLSECLTQILAQR